VELGICVAGLSGVSKGGLAGGSILGWPVCGSVMTQLEHCGWGWASTVDAWASIGVCSMS
jgi:hypothetical protein